MKLLTLITVIVSTLVVTLSGQSYPSIPDANLYTGNYRQAVEDFSDYIERNPENPVGYIQRAKAYGMLGEFTSKDNDIRKAIELNPVKTNLILNKSVRSSLIAKKAFDYKSNGDLFTKSPVRLEDYSHSLGELNVDSSSISIIKNILHSAIGYDLVKIEAQMNRDDFFNMPEYLRSDIVGLYALKSGDLEGAIKYFELSIEQNSEYALAYHNLSVAHYLAGDVESAVIEIKKALELNRNSPLFNYTKASFIESSNPELALDYYKEAIDLDNKYTEAKVNYSALLKSRGNYDDSLIQSASSLDSLDQLTERNFMEGGIHLVDGDYSAAVSSYTDFLTYQSDDPDGLYNRGLSYLLLTNYSAGCQDLEESINREPNSEREEVFKQLCLTIPVSWNN